MITILLYLVLGYLCLVGFSLCYLALQALFCVIYEVRRAKLRAVSSRHRTWTGIV